MSDDSQGRDLAAYAAAYSASEFEPVQARLRKRMLLELLARLRPGSVLEVGCGDDTLARHWRGFERFVVVEPAASFAAQARAALSEVPNTTVVEAALEDAGAELDGVGFDLILLSSLLHEVIDPLRLLSAVRQLCGEATVVHVNVPNADSLHRLLAVEMGLMADVTTPSARQRQLQQQRTFSMDGLRTLVEAAGFAVVDQGSYFVKPFSHAQMAQLQAIGFLTETMLEGLWGLARRLPQHGSEIFVNLRLRR